jgi:hypothetical protein
MHQLDVVAQAIEEVTEGAEEAELLAALQRLRETALAEGEAGEEWSTVLKEVSERCAEIVSEFFRVRLLAFGPVREYLETLEKPS